VMCAPAGGRAECVCAPQVQELRKMMEEGRGWVFASCGTTLSAAEARTSLCNPFPSVRPPPPVLRPERTLRESAGGSFVRLFVCASR
jgi:hypothetical protein